MDSFVMGEFDVPEHSQLQQDIALIEKEWFFAGEEYLWNAGIEKHLPSLERMINKKGQYFAHRLRFGASQETTFQVRIDFIMSAIDV